MELEAEIEEAFRKLRIAPPVEGRLSGALSLPGIGRDLVWLRNVKRDPTSWAATKKQLIALKKRSDALSKDSSAIGSLPIQWRLLVISLANEIIPSRPPRRGGAPKKDRARKAARIAAERYFVLTGNRPTRISPWEGGKAHGPFIDFLEKIFEILEIKASARSQAKAAIDFVNKNYPIK